MTEKTTADVLADARREWQKATDAAVAAFADRDAALERLGAVLAERDQLARLHEVATERVVGYAAVIEQATALLPTEPWRTHDIGDAYMVDSVDEARELLATAPTAEVLAPIRQAESYRFTAIIEEAAAILRTPGDHPINRALAVLAKGV